jgi:hypothetical protein
MTPIWMIHNVLVGALVLLQETKSKVSRPLMACVI